jgi:protein-tyrosine-phosphatase
MAEALFKSRLRRLGLRRAEWKVESAGTWAAENQPAARLAQQVMQQRGLELSAHRSRTVTGEMLQQFNLILTMEPNHKEALRIEFPALANRIFLLSEMAGRKISVEDPIAGELSDYQHCAVEIDSWLERGWDKILELSQS